MEAHLDVALGREMRTFLTNVAAEARNGVDAGAAKHGRDEGLHIVLRRVGEAPSVHSQATPPIRDSGL
jgi:hypothetical protein